MYIATLKELYRRDLERLKKEILAYQSEEALWEVTGEISNSGGNLCLHLIGNLNAYIGVGLAQSGYVRNRPLEFSDKHVPVAQMVADIDRTIEVVLAGLDKVEAEQLEGDYPLVIWQEPRTMIYTLTHIYSHLNYHLGQINYHRRLLDKT